MDTNHRTSSLIDQPRHAFSVLPIELLRMICEHLPPLSQIALALSCRALHACIYPPIKPLEISEKEITELLLSWEREIPGHFWCYLCNRFCAFEAAKFFGRSPRQSHECYVGLELQENSSENKLRLRFVPSLGLNFFDAHLVMNGHLYGEKHGLPMSVLTRDESHDIYVPPMLKETWDQSQEPSPWPDWIGRPLVSTPTSPDCQLIPRQYWATQKERAFHFTRQFQRDTGFDSPQSMIPWRVTRRISSRIIDDELYLSTFHRLSGPLGTQNILPAFLTKMNVSLCGHITCYGPAFPPGSSNGRSIVSSAYRNGLLGTLRRAKNKVVSCGVCYSDGSFSVANNRETQRWAMEFITFHRLGRCERPDNDVWQSMTTEPGAPRMRRFANIPHGPYSKGMIQKRWNDSLGILSERGLMTWGGP